jgi:Protein of unknown function (DUF3102)
MSNDITTTRVAANALSLPDLAAQANAEHAACLSAVSQAIEHARAAGEALIAAKTQCPHGEWGNWLSKNLRASHRTAQTYMQVARRWPEIAKTQRAADLSVRAALLLVDQRPAAGELPELDAKTRWVCDGEGGDVAEITPVSHDPRYHRVNVCKGVNGPAPMVTGDIRGFLYAGHPERLRQTLAYLGFRAAGEWQAEPWDGKDPEHIIAHRADPAGTTYPFCEPELWGRLESHIV